ncbi:MAG TPA: lactate racemase domain-containing protein [Gaiellaceae bacterium]|nr:lactate racemase domain-containing protein [Gaiellaceae bacterium]
MNPRVRRIPLLSGTRLVVAAAPDDALVLRPPAPPAGVADVGAAVRDALRFPLEGEPLEALARRGSRATIVVEPPALPIPSVPADPRQLAISAVTDELERLGIPTGYQTILVAGGLARRTSQRELGALVTPELARRFHGRVVVHDVEDPELVELPDSAQPPMRVNPALVDTDLVVVVTAAETVLNGGPAALLAASDTAPLRAASADSLLETRASQGWRLALALERALTRRVPTIGASLVLNHPHVTGWLRGYPYDPDAVGRVARSPFRHVFSALPGPVRRSVLRSLSTEMSAAGAFAGPPSVAHAEALLRTLERRRTELAEPLDALVIGIPATTPYLPRERPNPLLAAYLGLGLALRLWRDAFPLAEDGTAILVSRFARHFSHPTQQPYRSFFHATRIGRDPELLAEAEAAAAADARALRDYRGGRSVHPLLPFRDWDACQPALGRLGAVLVAGARDATAVRQLGFVPVHGVGAALDMARGRTADDLRVGFLLSPPYFPIRTG